jgi:hypothetical protein
MQYSSGYTTSFDAGHRYTVTVLWERDGAAGTDIETWYINRQKVDDLVYELADRDLAKMLGPHHPSAFGIASFFMERLSINLPVKKVEVHESSTDIRAAVEASGEF